MEQTRRRPGPKGPPRELLAVALRIYANESLTRQQLVQVMRSRAQVLDLTDKLPPKLHFKTIYNWAKKARDLGVTVEEAEALFQSIPEAEG